jgi:hypothetical protein
VEAKPGLLSGVGYDRRNGWRRCCERRKYYGNNGEAADVPMTKRKMKEADEAVGRRKSTESRGNGHHKFGRRDAKDAVVSDDSQWPCPPRDRPRGVFRIPHPVIWMGQQQIELKVLAKKFKYVHIFRSSQVSAACTSFSSCLRPLMGIFSSSGLGVGFKLSVRRWTGSSALHIHNIPSFPFA